MDITVLFFVTDVVQCCAFIRFSDYIAVNRYSVPGIAVQSELQSPLSRQI